MRLADAEKFPGNEHWTIYDGKGGVWRAKRDKTSKRWHAHMTNGTGHVSGDTLRVIRQAIAQHIGG